MAGLFISFEGCEGCGKSTQIRALAERLRNAGQTVQQTREPGGTDLGEAIRSLLQHDAAGEDMCAESELLLFAASRAQLTRQTIQPALPTEPSCSATASWTRPRSTRASHAPWIPGDVAAINRFAVGNTTPDLTLLIDLSPEVGLERVRARSQGQLDRIEREAIEFFQAVRAGYLALAARDPQRFVVLDGAQAIEALEHQIWDAVKPRLT